MGRSTRVKPGGNSCGDYHYSSAKSAAQKEKKHRSSLYDSGSVNYAKPQTKTSFNLDQNKGEDTVSNFERVNFSASEKWRVLKNITIVSFAFMIQFTAFQGTANLQSSINAKDGLGTVSLSVIYGAIVVSCIFVPTLLIRRMTVKWTLCFSMLCYAPYIGSQFFPRFYTLVPAGIILGLGAAPMWASKATYLTQLGQVYGKITDQSVEAIIVRFFGFFFLAFQAAEIWGNLISSVVLTSGRQESDDGNMTISTLDLNSCGANFCVTTPTDNENLQRPSDDEIFTITAIYLSCIITAAVIVGLFLDPLVRYGEKRRGTGPQVSIFQLLSATVVQLKKPDQFLLIPLTMFSGMQQAFLGANFTQAYVSCALGIHQIGYVMICFGMVNATCSIVFGTIMKCTGRIPIIILGAVVHGSVMVGLIFWRPSPEYPLVFYTISGLYGISDAVWQTQINGIYGALFRKNKEAAFSNYRLWESLGFVATYSFSTTLCARMKLYVLISLLLLGIIGWIIVEIRHHQKVVQFSRPREENQRCNMPYPSIAVPDTETDNDEHEANVVVTLLE